MHAWTGWIISTVIGQASDAAKDGKAADAAQAAATKAPSAGDRVNGIIHDPAGSIEGFFASIGNWLITRGPGILATLVLIILAWIFSKWARRATLNGLLRAKLDLTLAKFFANLVKWSIMFFAILTAAQTVGLETTSFAALIGATGLAVGLALQGNLSNLASGVLILIFRPFKLGDSIIIAGQSGVVDGIDLFTTNLDTPDNRRIIVPNGAVIGGVIENQTYHPERKIIFNVTIRGDVDFEKIRTLFRDAMRQVASSTTGALQNPPPDAALAELTGGQVWTLSLWAERAAYGPVREAALIAAKRVIDGNDLGVRPPTSVVISRQG